MSHFPLTSDSFTNEEVEAAISVLRSGRYTMGDKVKEFETALAKWLGVEHAVMVNSGSSANLILVDSLLRRTDQSECKLRVGDEVLVPALSWPTTVWPLVQLGLKPVFVDIDPITLAISLESAERAINSRTKGMFLIHVLGRAAPMKKYVEFCKAHDIVLIEDCCESFGAFDQLQHVGTFGHGGTLSHFYSHHLTTMEGGTVITNDKKLADDLRSLRAHGWLRDRSDKQELTKRYNEFDPRFLFVMPGYNVRPLEVEAAIGLVQLKRMDQMLEQREQLARSVNEIASSVEWLRIIGSETLSNRVNSRRERSHSWMNIPFVLSPDAPIDVKQVKDTLESTGVETRPIIAGNLSRHPACQNIKVRSVDSLRHADFILQNGFMIGCNPHTSAEQFDTLKKGFNLLKAV